MNYYDLIKQLCNSPAIQEDPPMSFNDTDEETIKYKQYLNQALEEIFSEEWNFRKTDLEINTVAGQASYDKPDGIIIKDGVEDENENIYKYNDDNSFYRYKIKGSKIVLYPIPDKVKKITVTYLNLLSGKNADGTLKVGLNPNGDGTDSPNIPETFHDLVVRKAELIYMRDKANKNSAQARADANKRINQLIDLDRGTLEASPIIVM